MDGLLVDTEPQWFAAESATVAQLGGVWGKQQQIDLLGSNLPVAARYMIEHTNSPLGHSDGDADADGEHDRAARGKCCLPAWRALPCSTISSPPTLRWHS